MSIAFEVTEKEPLSMAVVFGTEEAKVDENLAAFLKTINVGETKHYFNQMAVKQRGVRTITHVKFAIVPAETKKAGATMVVNLPAQKYLIVLVDADSFDHFIDGGYKTDLENALLARSCKIDFSRTLPFGERTESGSYQFYMPIK